LPRPACGERPDRIADAIRVRGLSASRPRGGSPSPQPSLREERGEGELQAFVATSTFAGNLVSREPNVRFNCQTAGRTSTHDPAAQSRPGYAKCSPSMNRGRREDQVPATAPTAPAQRRLRERALTTGTGGDTPAFPAQWLYGLYALFPVNLRCHRRPSEACQLRLDLAPAYARQNHTISPYASTPLVERHLNVHRIPARVRDDRDTPLEWTRTEREHSGRLGTGQEGEHAVTSDRWSNAWIEGSTVGAVRRVSGHSGPDLRATSITARDSNRTSPCQTRPYSLRLSWGQLPSR
jgi:hypothetical protein